MSKQKRQGGLIKWIKSLGTKYYYVSLGARNDNEAITSYAILKSKGRFPQLELPVIETEKAGYRNTQIFCVARISRKTAQWISDSIQQDPVKSLDELVKENIDVRN